MDKHEFKPIKPGSLRCGVFVGKISPEDSGPCELRVGDVIHIVLSEVRAENERLRKLIVDSQKPHGVCFRGLGFMFTSETQEACTACDAQRQMEAIATAALDKKE